jgi:hypothetical protein
MNLPPFRIVAFAQMFKCPREIADVFQRLSQGEMDERYPIGR